MSWECNSVVTFTLLGVQENVKEWAHTFPSGFPFWKLKSLWNPKFSKSNLKGQNSLDWKLPYTIGNLLRFKCLKWACMIHLSIYNTSYGWKKGRESKCQFDSRSIKVRNRLELRACKWRATYNWKSFDESYNFVFKLTLIGGLHKKLWVSKVTGVLISRISRLSTWESWEKWHLGVAPMANKKEYYEREGHGFSQVWAMVNLMSSCMPMTHLCTKSALTMH